MMRSTILALLLAGALAFAPASLVSGGKAKGCCNMTSLLPQNMCSQSSLSRFSLHDHVVLFFDLQQFQRAGSVSLNAEEMSKSIPFLVRPEKLDGSMPGDMGFDPMRL